MTGHARHLFNQVVESPEVGKVVRVAVFGQQIGSLGFHDALLKTGLSLHLAAVRRLIRRIGRERTRLQLFIRDAVVEFPARQRVHAEQRLAQLFSVVGEDGRGLRGGRNDCHALIGANCRDEMQDGVTRLDEVSGFQVDVVNQHGYEVVRQWRGCDAGGSGTRWRTLHSLTLRARLQTFARVEFLHRESGNHLGLAAIG